MRTDDEAAIDLASEQPFALGRLRLDPPVRQIVRDDGVSEVVEPRVMQVLIALVHAEGAIVTRDALTRSCWSGRIVGEDAINRVMSRLRRLESDLGADSFRLETVTKIGYRLVALSDGAAAGETAVGRPGHAPRYSRRGLVATGAAVGGAAVLGGAAWWLSRGARQNGAYVAPPANVAALVAQAQTALSQSNREGQNQAIGLYQRVVALAPDFADGWGGLALTYGASARFRSTAEGETLNARAKSAAERALALDPANPYATVALSNLGTAMGNWLRNQQALRAAAERHPTNGNFQYLLGFSYAAVGRMRESAAAYDRMARLMPPSPDPIYARMIALWSANRLEDTDRAMAEAAALYPTHFANWFGRFYILMYSGRPAQAIAMTEDPNARPSNIPEREIASVVRVAHALQTRAPAEIDAVVAEYLALAHKGSGFAENAIQFVSALGRVDAAFAVAEAYYFSAGFDVPELRFTPEQASYRPRGDRLTGFLFNPATAAMRADPRFNRLVGRLGLERYWQLSGSTPDYRRG